MRSFVHHRMAGFCFSPFPVRTTSRLVLRPLEKEDAPVLFFLRTDPEVIRYLDHIPPASIAEVETLIGKLQNATNENKSIFWTISLRDSPEMIGTICLWNLAPEKMQGEIGYILHPEFQGRGLMKEAIETVLDYGFHTMQLSLITGWTRKDNLASIQVMERCGFRRDLKIEAAAAENENMICLSRTP